MHFFNLSKTSKIHLNSDVALHMLLNLSQAIVLNVAINSFNKALLTIMISNQVRFFVYRVVEKKVAPI